MDTHRAEKLKQRIDRAFPASNEPPSLTLRGGNALDDYDSPEPYAAAEDVPDAAYLEAYHFGIHHLDPASWRYYLPILLKHSLDDMLTGTSVAVDTFLFSLRPPDRDPPRFATLADEQRAVVVAVLEALSFGEGSKYQDDALLALQEYWSAD